MTQDLNDEGGDGEGIISPGRVLQMDLVNQTAGRLGFRGTDSQAGGLVQRCRTEH